MSVTATAPARAAGRRFRPGRLLLNGTAVGYLAVMLLLPLGVLVWESLASGPERILKVLTDPLAMHALGLSLATALIMVAINAVMGTATAWVLVRVDFPGKSLVNALVDLPFAVPTVVTGVMLVALYGPTSTLGTVLGSWGIDVIYQQPGIVLALLFVSYPFVVRTVQPVLMEQDLAEEEAAATLGAGRWTTFWKVTLPTLWPAIVSGSALSLSRALGEFGSVVMVAGNRPLATRTAPIHIFAEIEGGRRVEAMVLSTVLLACSLGILLVFGAVGRNRRSGHGV